MAGDNRDDVDGMTVRRVRLTSEPNPQPDPVSSSGTAVSVVAELEPEDDLVQNVKVGSNHLGLKPSLQAVSVTGGLQGYSASSIVTSQTT